MLHNIYAVYYSFQFSYVFTLLQLLCKLEIQARVKNITVTFVLLSEPLVYKRFPSHTEFNFVLFKIGSYVCSGG